MGWGRCKGDPRASFRMAGRREDGIGFVAEAPIPFTSKREDRRRQAVSGGRWACLGMSRDSGSWENVSQFVETQSPSREPNGSLRTCRGDSVRNGSRAHGRLRYDISPVCCNELEAVLICRATPTRR